MDVQYSASSVTSPRYCGLLIKPHLHRTHNYFEVCLADMFQELNLLQSQVGFVYKPTYSALIRDQNLGRDGHRHGFWSKHIVST